MNPTEAVVKKSQRIQSIDLIRGISVLGILFINIQLFAFPFPVKDRPNLWGDFTGINRWIWILFDLFAEKRFMNIFCILFGTSILLFCESAARRTTRIAGPFFRRYIGLIFIGFFHALFLWYGDILITYGIVALFLFFVRNKKPTFFFAGFAVTFLVAYGVYEALFWAVKSGQLDLTAYFDAKSEIQTFRGPYLEQLKFRWDRSAFYEFMFFTNEDFWRALSLMLLGMGLYKVHFFSLDRYVELKKKLIWIGIPIGYLLAGTELSAQFSNQVFSAPMIMNFASVNYWVSPLIALGYISIILFWIRSHSGKKAKALLAQVGQMSLSNYILTTVICTSLFYGHGLGWFGALSRVQISVLMLGIWLFLIAFSAFWMKHFEHGPVERVWRWMTWLGSKSQLNEVR